MQELSPPLAEAARTVATKLAERGRRGWIVGGAVRDLALGRAPSDVDMASAAAPEELEALFPRTIPVGRAFGTVIVVLGDVEVQHTTFRSETGYADARRPTSVTFGATVEEDASRRDFTCNALYLDPIAEELVDPTGGLADLERRVLRSVGDPGERFREDGLRLVRMARFAAVLGLDPAPELLAAARTSRDALRGVSPERVLVELETLFDRPGHARALALLAECALLARALPGMEMEHGERADAWWRAIEPVVAGLRLRPGLALGLAALYGPAPEDVASFGEASRRRALERLDLLRVSRATRQRVGAIWSIACDVATLENELPSRARRVRWMRDEGFDEGVELARAWRAPRSSDLLERLRVERAAASDAELRPEPFVRSKDLEDARVPRGPRWGTLLHEAETLQLDRVHASRDEALAWLRARATQ